MKRIIAAILLAGLVLLPTQVRAHVLVTDTSRQTGTVLHIAPDDDPIAGKSSHLFFELDNDKASASSHVFKLFVTNTNTQEQLEVPLHAVKNTISATYTFPTQDTYRITLLAEPSLVGSTAYEFNHTQRVSRGTQAVAQASSPHSGAIFGVVASISILLVLGIIAFNKRKDILAYSKFK